MKRFLFFASAFFAIHSVSFGQTTINQNNVTTITVETNKVEPSSADNAKATDPSNPYGIKDNSNLTFINTADNPGPVFVNTGNVEEDTKNYVIAKDAWIKENTIPKPNSVEPK